MTLERRRILSSRNWPHEAAQAPESMAGGRMQAVVTRRIPAAVFWFPARRSELPRNNGESPERAPSATIGHDGLA